jgi:hypothetical protein
MKKTENVDCLVLWFGKYHPGDKNESYDDGYGTQSIRAEKPRYLEIFPGRIGIESYE